MSQTTLERGSLAELRSFIENRDAHKHDVVVPSTKIVAASGVVVAKGAGPEGAPDTLEAFMSGATAASDLIVKPTRWAISQLGTKLKIPTEYLQRCAGEHVALFDANVNGWLARRDKPLLLRSIIDPVSDEPGILRSVLSDGFKLVEDIDVLFAALDAIRATGRTPEVTRCSLTENRFFVQVAFPELSMAAPALLDRYRVPGDLPSYNFGYGGIADPVVWSGIEFGNSEVGDGAAYVVPRLLVLRCRNGLKQMSDISRHVHLGSRLDEGVIDWSMRTQTANIELIRSQMVDAITTFLSPEYLEAKVAAIEEKAGVRVAKPEEAIKVIAQKLSFTEAQRDVIFAHFVEGGQMTAGGVLNAVTSAAQMFGAEEGYEMENKAMRAFELAAA